MQRVTDLADPRRCKAPSLDGQCRNVAEEGSDYCRAHAGIDHMPAVRMRKYMLANAVEQGMLDRFTEDDNLKSLREEIGLVRMMVQNTLRMASTDMEKIQAYSKVNTLLLTLERLMKTCHTLEKSLGELVGKPALLRLGQALCQAVVERLEGLPNYEDLVDALIVDIMRAIQDVDNNEPDPGAVASE